MNSLELFEFQSYLAQKDFKKVEYIFFTQCIQKEFTEFHTSLGSNSKDYLSYLLASSLIDSTIENNKSGHEKLLRIANGYTECFFQTTIYHTYNLSVVEDKEEIFTVLLETAKELGKPKFNSIEFKEMQFRDYVHNFVQEMELNPKFYFLSDYASYHKKLQIYLLQDRLHVELDTNSTKKKSSKI